MKLYLVAAFKKVSYKKVVQAKNKSEAEKIFMEYVDEMSDLDKVDDYEIEKVYKYTKCN